MANNPLKILLPSHSHDIHALHWTIHNMWLCAMNLIPWIVVGNGLPIAEMFLKLWHLCACLRVDTYLSTIWNKTFSTLFNYHASSIYVSEVTTWYNLIANDAVTYHSYHISHTSFACERLSMLNKSGMRKTVYYMLDIIKLIDCLDKQKVSIVSVMSTWPLN